MLLYDNAIYGQKRLKISHFHTINIVYPNTSFLTKDTELETLQQLQYVFTAQ